MPLIYSIIYLFDPQLLTISAMQATTAWINSIRPDHSVPMTMLTPCVFSPLLPRDIAFAHMVETWEVSSCIFAGTV